MNRMLRVVMLSCASAGLAACASMPETASRTPAQDTGVQAGKKIVADSEYIAYVERAALRRGVQVQWVNPPTKQVASR